MSGAGIFLDGIMGWDNSFSDELNFVSCGAGIKQRVDPAYVGGDAPGMTYLDKNVFYHCQFVDNGIALDMLSKRLSGGNHFTSSRFVGNDKVGVFTSWDGTVFANDDFENNGGNPMIEQDYNSYIEGSFFVLSRFRANAKGVAMLPEGATCEGCSFARGTSTTATIAAAGKRVFLINSRSVDMPVGPVSDGLFANNLLGADPTLSHPTVVLTGGKATVLAAGTSTALPQLLWGEPWY